MAELSRGEIQDILSEYATQSPEYRGVLLQDPRKVLEAQLNREIPDWLKIKAVEETADTLYVVVPHVAGEELSDEDLEMVAGGKGGGKGGGGDTYTCNDIKGIGTRVDITTKASVF